MKSLDVRIRTMYPSTFQLPEETFWISTAQRTEHSIIIIIACNFFTSNFVETLINKEWARYDMGSAYYPDTASAFNTVLGLCLFPNVIWSGSQDSQLAKTLWNNA